MDLGHAVRGGLHESCAQDVTCVVAPATERFGVVPATVRQPKDGGSRVVFLLERALRVRVDRTDQLVLSFIGEPRGMSDVVPALVAVAHLRPLRPVAHTAAVPGAVVLEGDAPLGERSSVGAPSQPTAVMSSQTHRVLGQSACLPAATGERRLKAFQNPADPVPGRAPCRLPHTGRIVGARCALAGQS